MILILILSKTGKKYSQYQGKLKNKSFFWKFHQLSESFDLILNFCMLIKHRCIFPCFVSCWKCLGFFKFTEWL